MRASKVFSDECSRVTYNSLRGNDMPTDKHVRGTITSRRDVAPDLWTIRLRPEAAIPFEPGQYATLGVEAEPRMIERAYSIAASPLEEELEFFIELVPEGKLTPRLYALREGDTLWVRKIARGHFVLDARPEKLHHVMVSTVTGIAPFLSMGRTEARRRADGHESDRRFYMLQGASRSWELAYETELRRMDLEYEWLTYVPTVSRPHEDPEWKGLTGRVHDLVLGHLEKFCCEPSSTAVYLCGHPGMIEAAKQMLIEAGFDPKDIHDEKYWIPKVDRSAAQP